MIQYVHAVFRHFPIQNYFKKLVVESVTAALFRFPGCAQSLHAFPERFEKTFVDKLSVCSAFEIIHERIYKRACSHSARKAVALDDKHAHALSCGGNSGGNARKSRSGHYYVVIGKRNSLSYVFVKHTPSSFYAIKLL